MVYRARLPPHLTGADDHTDDLRAAMHRQEQQWLDEAEQHGLLNHLDRRTTRTAEPTGTT